MSHMNEEIESEEFLKSERSKPLKDSENQSVESQPGKILWILNSPISATERALKFIEDNLS